MGWVFFTFLACLYFSFAYNAHPDYLNMDAYTRGLSPTPYQYRMLPMLIFRALAHQPFIESIALHAPVEFRSPFQLVQLGLTLVSALGAVFANYGTMKCLTSNDIVFSRWASLLLLYMAYMTLVPGWGLNYTYPYDTPSLLFFCFGIYLVVSRKLWLYYVVLPLAVLNRETACFLILFFLIWRWHGEPERSSRRVLAIHGFLQAAIWLAVRRYTVYLFAGNASEGDLNAHYIVGKFLFNLKELFLPQQWPVLLSCGGFLLPFLILNRRWIRNRALAWSCAIILPLWFLGMMLVGIVIEIRVFSETVALTAPAIGLILYNRFWKTSAPSLSMD